MFRQEESRVAVHVVSGGSIVVMGRSPGMNEEQHHFVCLWGCGNNCGFKALEESFPKKPGRWGQYYCPWCGQEGKNLVTIMPLGSEDELLVVWEEVRA